VLVCDAVIYYFDSFAIDSHPSFFKGLLIISVLLLLYTHNKQPIANYYHSFSQQFLCFARTETRQTLAKTHGKQGIQQGS